jgi:hypothetical protein
MLDADQDRALPAVLDAAAALKKSVVHIVRFNY